MLSIVCPKIQTRKRTILTLWWIGSFGEAVKQHSNRIIQSIFQHPHLLPNLWTVLIFYAFFKNENVFIFFSCLFCKYLRFISNVLHKWTQAYAHGWKIYLCQTIGMKRKRQNNNKVLQMLSELHKWAQGDRR